MALTFEWQTIMLLLITGATAGIAAGFIGIGGGVIMVPVLLELYRSWDFPPSVLVQVAMGTSLAVATLSVSSSALRHHLQGNILWKRVPMIFPMSMLGGWIAGKTAPHLEGIWLQCGLAAVLLLAAVKMILETGMKDRPERNVHWSVWGLMGFGTGIFAGFSGLAGGLVLIPVLSFVGRVPTRYLAGTSSAVVMFTAFAATLGYAFSTPPIDLPDSFIGYTNYYISVSLAVTSIPGAQLGAYLNKKAGSLLYKRIFGVLLVIVVIRLFLTAGKP